jgi:hypothetical protein
MKPSNKFAKKNRPLPKRKTKEIEITSPSVPPGGYEEEYDDDDTNLCLIKCTQTWQ